MKLYKYEMLLFMIFNLGFLWDSYYSFLSISILVIIFPPTFSSFAVPSIDHDISLVYTSDIAYFTLSTNELKGLTV